VRSKIKAYRLWAIQTKSAVPRVCSKPKKFRSHHRRELL